MQLADWLEGHIWPAEAKLTAEDVYKGSLLACLEMIRSGTTAFADMYFYMDETAKAVEISGLRASLCHGLIELWNEEKGETDLKEGKRFVRAWQGLLTQDKNHVWTPCSEHLFRGIFLQRVRRGSQQGQSRHSYYIPLRRKAELLP